MVEPLLPTAHGAAPLPDGVVCCGDVGFNPSIVASGRASRKTMEIQYSGNSHSRKISAVKSRPSASPRSEDAAPLGKACAQPGARPTAHTPPTARGRRAGATRRLTRRAAASRCNHTHPTPNQPTHPNTHRLHRARMGSDGSPTTTATRPTDSSLDTRPAPHTPEFREPTVCPSEQAGISGEARIEETQEPEKPPAQSTKDPAESPTPAGEPGIDQTLRSGGGVCLQNLLSTNSGEVTRAPPTRTHASPGRSSLGRRTRRAVVRGEGRGRPRQRAAARRPKLFAQPPLPETCTPPPPAPLASRP